MPADQGGRLVSEGGTTMGLFSGKRRRGRRGQASRRQTETIDQSAFIYGDFGSGYEDRRPHTDADDDRSHYGAYDPGPFNPHRGFDTGTSHSHHTDSGGHSDSGSDGGGGGGD